MASVMDLLYKTLDNLEKEDLKRFRSFLKEDGRIGKGHLENAGATNIVDMMLESYTREEAVKITLDIMRKLNQNQLALDLENMYTKGNKA